MPKFHFEIPHSLTAADAKSRLERFVESLQAKFQDKVSDLSQSWSGNTLNFGFKTFGIKIPKNELFPENVANDPNLVQNGNLTPAGIALLKEKLPHSDFTALEADPKLENMSKLFTVNSLTRYVEQKLSQPQPTA